jgi:hypothetical protein
MKGAGTIVLIAKTLTMTEQPTQAGRFRREASAAPMPPKRLLVDELVIQVVAKPRRKET